MNIHSAAHITGTTTTQTHLHFFLGVLEILVSFYLCYLMFCWRKGYRTGCCVTTRSVEGASGLEGCCMVMVLASQEGC